MPRARSSRVPTGPPAESIAEVATAVGALWHQWHAEHADVELWFRGHSSDRHDLRPSLYRDTHKQKHEETLLVSFQHYCSGIDREMASLPDWDLLAEAQHYGIPTRLLDWTSSMQVGVFFALSTVEVYGEKRIERLGDIPLHVLRFLAEHEKSHGPVAVYPYDNPCLWILDPSCLNKHSIDSDEGPMCPGGKFTEHWLWKNVGKTPRRFRFEKKNYTNRNPISLLPLRRHRRIQAQNGLFTVHGTARDPIETLNLERLHRVSISGLRAASTFLELRISGLTCSALFPEKDKVATDIVRDYVP